VAVNHATASSFADDTRILTTITDRWDCERLQEDLSATYDWAQVNNMQINGTKLEVLRYRGSGRAGIEHRYLTPDNSEIEEKRLVRVLGVLLNTQVNFGYHIAAITARGRRQMGWIWRTFRAKEAEPMITLFRVLVIPILEYYAQGPVHTRRSAVTGRGPTNLHSPDQRDGRFKLLGEVKAPGSVLTAKETREVCHSVYMENNNRNGTKLRKRDLQD
jgi:hypothetical protein